MALDSFIELLESEYIDGLMDLLSCPYSLTSVMQEIYKGREKSNNDYKSFFDYYEKLSHSRQFERVKKNIDEADKKNKEHSPHFEALKLYIHQIDTSIEHIGQFFEQYNTDQKNFRENFKPFSGYLEVICDAMNGIKCLNRIYANIVDTDKITHKLYLEGKYHQPLQVNE
jgi:hypothetical protein